MQDKLLNEHLFIFNKEDNGGESFALKTKHFGNGDPGEFYVNQTLKLQSYSNSCEFHLFSAILTPQLLRKLANELEELESQSISKSTE